MKNLLAFLLLALGSVTVFGQQPSASADPATRVRSDTTILIEESRNLKSDLAQLRSMLNVLASQESGMDARSFAALQTNRQMWQVIIARLAELTQRIDAMEQRQKQTSEPKR